MKKYNLIIIAIIYWLTINTRYFWEDETGLFALPLLFTLLIILFAILFISTKEIYLVFKYRDFKTFNVIRILILLTVTVSTLLKPAGIIDFSRFESEDILIASREGSGSCHETLKLKHDLTFYDRTICFGISKTSGQYFFKNDTIYFYNIIPGTHQESYYKFAVIKKSLFSTGSDHKDIVRFKDINDTLGSELQISKNIINQLQTIP